MPKFQKTEGEEEEREQEVITAFVRENCDRIHSRDDVARKLGVCPETVSNHIRNETGMGFTEFLHQHQVARAMNLLESTSLNVSQIAGQLGFASPEHFSKVFHKVTGSPPTHYRLAKRAEKANAE